MKLIDKYEGCLLGGATGDALGYPVEFISASLIKEYLGDSGVTGFDSLKQANLPHATDPIGFYSDDTQMTLATANGIINADSPSLNSIMESIAVEYVKWLDSSENNRAPGNTCIAGGRNLKNHISWRESGTHGKGCGAAMRTAPVGLFFYDNTYQLMETAFWIGGCTHGEEASEAGVSIAYAVAEAVKRQPCTDYDPKHVLHGLIEMNRHPQITNKMQQIDGLLNEEHEPAMLESIGSAWNGDEAAAMALYCFLRNPEDYKQTVLMATNIDGDSDSVASIAGQISAAYNGISAIPQQWQKQVEKPEYTISVAQKLLEKRTQLQ